MLWTLQYCPAQAASSLSTPPFPASGSGPRESVSAVGHLSYMRQRCDASVPLTMARSIRFSLSTRGMMIM